MREKGSPAVAVVLGTKAELIKMSPVLRELSRRRIPTSLVYTGQHNIEAELKEHKLSKPDFVFDSSAKGRGRFSSKISASLWSLSAFLWIRGILSRTKPTLVLVHGDTMTTAAAALAAKTANPRPSLAHVEAGLRSGSLREPFPEELSRRVTDSLSDWLFAPTYRSAGNLLSEGRPRDTIIITGNTNIDVVSSYKNRTPRNKGTYIIAKLHRHENIHSRKRLSSFVSVLVNSPFPVKLVLTENLERMLRKFSLAIPKKVKILPFLPQKKFIRLVSGARAILTDAGGETEEATFLGIPCIQFREKSERQEAELSGAALRTTDDRKILAALTNLRKTKHLVEKPARDVFGSGRAAREIVDFISKNIL
jgi:UDP-N-acetylglucosamine 2-epimerase (non-hydrolysing)